MAYDYRTSRGPLYDEDCDCHCSNERNQFQAALDEIAELLKDETATTITDGLLDKVWVEVDKR